MGFKAPGNNTHPSQGARFTLGNKTEQWTLAPSWLTSLASEAELAGMRLWAWV